MHRKEFVMLKNVASCAKVPGFSSIILKKKKTIFSVEVIFGEVEFYDNVCIRALVYLTECMRNEHHHICQSKRENLNIDF